MEILIATVVIGLVGYWVYNHFNKDKADGSHVLDSLTKPVETAPYKVPEPPATTPIPMVVETPAPKAKRAPAAKKPAAPKAPAKPRAKKTPAK